MSMVSGVSVLVAGQKREVGRASVPAVLRSARRPTLLPICRLTSVYRHLTPETYLFLTPKMKQININKINPYFINYM